MNKIFIYIICLILCACSSGKKDGIIIIDSFQETSNSHILEDFFDSLTVTPLVFDWHFYDNMLLTYKDCGDYFAI